MDMITFLGASGTRTPSQGTTCLRVSEHCVIDAGNLIDYLKNEVFSIEHIFLTHAHLDHIIDIPFLADLFVTKQHKPLKIYALQETLAILREHILNDFVWPNFEEIRLIEHTSKTIELIEIEVDTPYFIDGITLTPFKTNHCSGSCGYMIENDGTGILFTSDTYKCPKIWELLNNHPHIHSLVIDVSFPSSYEKLAYDSKHLTPKLLSEELQTSVRNDFTVYVIHVKPLFETEIQNELDELAIFSNGGYILHSGDRLPYDSKITPDKQSKYNYSIVSQMASIGTALSSEKNIDSLLEKIIIHAKKLTHADAGTLYLYNPQTKQLDFKVIQNDTLNISMGGTSGAIEWKSLDLFDQNGVANHTMVAVVCALNKEMTINIPNIRASKLYDFTGTIDFDKQTGYHSVSTLVVPLKDHEDNLIGVFQLINKLDDHGVITPFNISDEELALSLASQAAVAINKQQLINDLELLLESFLNTINVAIEEKSPYTAGHINRMVKLALALAKAINEDQETFPNMHYNEDQLTELKLSALMHDIGKIATPEYIIDKSTKLETIYDRIESVKLKYEILKRDAKIAYLEKNAHTTDDDDLKQFQEDYDNTLKTLEEEYHFLTEANQGSEFFSDEKVAIIHTIAKRNLSIGDHQEPILNEDELENLCVQKGTLTGKQRQVINNHAEMSLKMLNQLPFPRKFSRVAEIASRHHEKVNGKGYPLGLKGDELSFEARILAIADIFEALSASDRPYKKAKKLSEVMEILYQMAKENDIDRDIFRFFYESGLYLKYASQILPPEKIDTINFDFNL
ncbi:MAG: MBL fold metallo-hydrolase [Sulfuricurvum sp.]|uniref:HD domain-containing phosphohydrolase n=1 Tax=Sulfuricurvum sp. TaxID=2025608 RepID=UPI0026317F6B|nr:HD domain-containing phosphohydrolase [Sulfuricurvum sp.]MDD2829468.1 MBL fold metallo-hydrolase [Sulfuricurvum sp.]MDD4948449.1 MBL fold metallo-hydrolase [Sulfuricurvum sp.]